MSTECKTVTPAIRSLANTLYYLHCYEHEQRLYTWMAHEMKARLAEILSQAAPAELVDTESMRKLLIENAIEPVLEFYKPLLDKLGLRSHLISSGIVPRSLPAWETYFSFSVSLCFDSHGSIIIADYCTDKEFV